MAGQIERRTTTATVVYVVEWEGDAIGEEQQQRLYPELVRVDLIRNHLRGNRWQPTAVTVKGRYCRKDGKRGDAHEHYYGSSRLNDAPDFARKASEDAVASLS